MARRLSPFNLLHFSHISYGCPGTRSLGRRYSRFRNLIRSAPLQAIARFSSTAMKTEVRVDRRESEFWMRMHLALRIVIFMLAKHELCVCVCVCSSCMQIICKRIALRSHGVCLINKTDRSAGSRRHGTYRANKRQILSEYLLTYQSGQQQHNANGHIRKFQQTSDFINKQSILVV